MKKAKAIVGLLSLFVTLPIALYLQYKILTLVRATDVMWLLFYVQVPMMILLNIVTKLAEAVDD